MRSSTVRAGLVAVILAILMPYPAVADSSASATNVSPAVGKTLAQAQKLIQASPPDFKSALDMVHQAQALPSRTPIDDYYINQFLGQIAAGQKDLPTAATAFEAVADSPLIDQDANKTKLLENAILISTAAGHYRKAIHYGDVLAAAGPLSYQADNDLAVAYYKMKNQQRARDFAQKSVDGAKAAGQQPDQNSVLILSSAQPAATGHRRARKHS
jgi:tetratricopeptide (TPR) repeat protein